MDKPEPSNAELRRFRAETGELLGVKDERGLEARFGEAYRAYRRRVPRWIGTIRRE